jgi:peptidoglycan/xylan/chitin deacetylase (PgdA/CDA1 family)
MASPTFLRASLEALSWSGLAAAGRPLFQGCGAIMCLHQVFPGGGNRKGFAPNHQLEVDAAFLHECLTGLRKAGYRFISLDKMVDELTWARKMPSPFLVFTLDDGYRDNLVHAAPVFRRHNCPYAIFVAPRIADGTCELWWKLLEQMISQTTKFSAVIGGSELNLNTSTVTQKRDAYREVFGRLKATDEYEQRRWIRAVCAQYGIDVGGVCRDLAMAWDEIRSIAEDPLCTIGAHTLNHYAVARLPAIDCRRELVASRKRIAEELRREIRYFAYPYGDVEEAGPRDFAFARDAGFRAALTTRKGMIYPEHVEHLHALPRVMLSGRYQSLRLVKALVSGTPLALLNQFRKINVAEARHPVSTSSG